MTRRDQVGVSPRGPNGPALDGGRMLGSSLYVPGDVGRAERRDRLKRERASLAAHRNALRAQQPRGNRRRKG